MLQPMLCSTILITALSCVAMEEMHGRTPGYFLLKPRMTCGSQFLEMLVYDPMRSSSCCAGRRARTACSKVSLSRRIRSIYGMSARPSSVSRTPPLPRRRSG